MNILPIDDKQLAKGAKILLYLLRTHSSDLVYFSLCTKVDHLAYTVGSAGITALQFPVKNCPMNQPRAFALC